MSNIVMYHFMCCERGIRWCTSDMDKVYKELRERERTVKFTSGDYYYAKEI